MKDFCPFLKKLAPNNNQSCIAGINFAAVGEERSLCQRCPIAVGFEEFTAQACISSYSEK